MPCENPALTRQKRWYYSIEPLFLYIYTVVCNVPRMPWFVKYTIVHEMTDEQIDQELKQLLAKPGAAFGNG